MSYAPFPLVWGFFGSGGGGGGGPSFGVIQTDFGTYPTASGSSDVLTLISADSTRYYFTGTALTDTVTLTVTGLIPSGGSYGQILTKASGSNFDVEWRDGVEVTSVYNNSGATITKGSVVYINGAQGNLPTIALAKANADITSAQTYGLVVADISNMSSGAVVASGQIRDLNTFGVTEGVILYLSPTTAGAYTTTKPAAPDHIVYIGVCTRAHPSQGTIEVKIQNGYELEELHNVSIVTPTNGQILQYDSSTSLWKNATSSGSITGTTNYITKFATSSSLGNSLFFDNGTNIGLGVTTPIAKFHVSSVDKTVSSTLFTSDYIILSAENTAPGFNVVTSSNTAGHRGVFKSTRSRGTLDAPTAVQSGDQTLSIVGAGHDGTTNITTAGITFAVDGTVATNQVPQAITFATGDGATRTERMRINSTGQVGINFIPSSASSPLTVKSTAVPSTAESIASFFVTDSNASLNISNASTVNGTFVPSLAFTQATGNTNAASMYQGFITLSDDTGTEPVHIFRAQTQNAGVYAALTTRPLYQFRNWSTNMMTMLASGNLGIGTDTPSEKLNVAGNILATGTILGSNLSGTNTGDETTASIQTKLGVASTSTSGYLTFTDWNTFNGKQAALGYTPVNKAGDTMTGALIVSGSVTTGNSMLRVTNTGTGDCLVVEDAANPDASNFKIDANGFIYTGSLLSSVGSSGRLQILDSQNAFVECVAGSTRAVTFGASTTGNRFNSAMGSFDISTTDSGDAITISPVLGDGFGPSYYTISNGTQLVTGINNITPTEALDVSGNIKASGTVTGSNIANATTTGFLSSTDWKSFDARMPYKGSIGYVTAVVANITPSAIGMAAPTGTGTSSAVTPTFTSFYTTRKILEYTASALSSAIAGWRFTAEYVGRTATANAGGFKFSTRFGFQAGFASGGTNRRFFCGLTSSTVSPSDVNPSTLGATQDLFGIGLDNGDANFQIMHSAGAANATKVNLGANFARPTADKANFYQIDIHLAPNSANFNYTVTELISGNTTSGTISATVPVVGAALSPRCWVSAGGVSSAVGVAMEYIYLES